VYDVVVARQLVVDAHVAQVVLADETEAPDVHSEVHAVLATAPGDRQLLQLSDHLIHETIQLTGAARISRFKSNSVLRSRIAVLRRCGLFLQTEWRGLSVCRSVRLV